jgi:hypothetical protein
VVLPHLSDAAWQADNWSHGTRGKARGYRAAKELLVMSNAELLQELDELMAAFQAWIHKMVHQLAHEDDNQGN